MINANQQHAQAIPGSGWSLLILTFVLMVAGVSHGMAAAPTATQEISLEAGWNAVWLEVEPTHPDDHETKPSLAMSPEDAFDTVTNTAIEVIASPKELAGLAEFFGDDPTSEKGTFNQAAWQQWLRVDPGGVTDLVSISGNRAYLIKTSASVSFSVTGSARFFRPTWVPDRYNLVGFGLDGSPSFTDFFSASGAKHPVDRIFTLSPDGSWAKVDTMSDVTMESGRAYWIFSSGPSDYMGPVAVDFDGATTGKLGFGGPTDAVTVGSDAAAAVLDLEELVFTNLSNVATEPQLKFKSSDGPGDLALRVVKPVPGSFEYVSGNSVDGDLEKTVGPEASTIVTLGAQRNWDFGAVGRTNLYRLKTGAGSEFWLPVTASKTDLQFPSDLLPESGTGNVAGLWVGEIVFNSVSSIAENGAPVVPAAAPSSMRVLLHSDEGGTVSLLSQVTIMQTKSADSEVAPSPVLVVDPRQIPFFEGVKERNGKRVGLRLEAVAYDMPRKLDAVSQELLLNATEAGSDPPIPLYPDLLNEAGLSDFLQKQNSRPPTLNEAYHFALPMAGTLGAGKTVRTTPASLTLDPFHRSNPFRHVYHKKHNRGPQINRTFECTFDPGQPVADLLRGTFTETILGVTSARLTLRGKITLRRVSTVAHLGPGSTDTED
ncbi:MAG: hypothetical protein ACJA16_001352 [Akkermansiaceae bacterium]|jgi:hypothetical protein